ncbi:MAG: CoA-transferase [Solirubrobacteraceae bacterium]
MSTQPAATLVASPQGEPVRDKTVTAAEAIWLIRDRATVVIGGFLGAGFPEELTLALEERFRGGGAPRDLTIVFPVAAGDLKGRGLDCLAHPGLVRRAIGGHWAAAPAVQQLAVEGEIEAYNLPLGSMSQLFRDIAAHKPTAQGRCPGRWRSAARARVRRARRSPRHANGFDAGRCQQNSLVGPPSVRVHPTPRA